MENIYNSYERFILSEKESNLKLSKILKIKINTFNESEYTFIKNIWKDLELINKIYNVIDDIIGNNFSNLRFLVIGDFLFSMTSYDFADPANLIYKTSRNSYIEKIKVRSMLNEYLGYDPYDYIDLHKKLLIGLNDNSCIKKTVIKSKSNESWETIVYMILESKYPLLYSENSLGVSNYPFKLIKLYGSKYCISFFRNIWKAKRKKREMENFDIQYNGIIRTNHMKLYISKELFELNKKNINNQKNKLLEETNSITIEEYFSKLIRVLKDESYTKKLIEKKEIIENLNIEEIKKLRWEIKNERITLMKNFQKLISMQILSKNIFNKNIYIPCFIDNRGRQYFNTLISPTFYKLFRYLYEFTEKKDFLNLEESIYYNKIMEYEYTIEEFNLNKFNSYKAIILFIEIGKFFIKNDNMYMIKTETIIKKGIENYKIRNNNIKIEDIPYINKIYNLIENLLLGKEINENTIIFKDATASGLQNYGLLLEYKNDKLKYLNIDGEDWCDTYQYIIDKFLKNKLDNMSELKKRKYWKKTIMTIPYNAVWYSCFTEFIEELRKDNIEYKEFSKEKKEKIKKIHHEFYLNVKNDIKNEFYENKLKNLKIFNYNKWIIVNNKEYKINYNKKRDKYTNTLYMLTHDEKKTQKALEANNMHYLDAELVKEILSKFEIIPIHDCFGIRLNELHLVIDIINKYYSIKIGKETYSIHILL